MGGNVGCLSSHHCCKNWQPCLGSVRARGMLNMGVESEAKACFLRKIFLRFSFVFLPFLLRLCIGCLFLTKRPHMWGTLLPGAYVD